MLKRIVLVVSALMLISVGLVSPALAQGPVMYGANGGFGGTGTDKGAVMIVDQTTANTTIVGTPVISGLTGLAFNSQNRLFATTADGSGTTSKLIEINPQTGALIGSPIVLSYSGGVNIADISFQPGTDVLYGLTGLLPSAGLLVTIDVTTGVTTLVGDTTVGGLAGLAFARNGTLYMAYDNLYTLNPNSGAILTTVSFVNNIRYMGLGVRPTDGMLFANDDNNLGTFGDLYIINPTTGQNDLIGSIGAGRRTHDITFLYTPPVGGVAMPFTQATSSFNFTMLASGAALVLGLGLVLLGRLRRV